GPVVPGGVERVVLGRDDAEGHLRAVADERVEGVAAEVGGVVGAGGDVDPLDVYGRGGGREGAGEVGAGVEADAEGTRGAADAVEALDEGALEGVEAHRRDLE